MKFSPSHPEGIDAALEEEADRLYSHAEAIRYLRRLGKKQTAAEDILNIITSAMATSGARNLDKSVLIRRSDLSAVVDALDLRRKSLAARGATVPPETGRRAPRTEIAGALSSPLLSLTRSALRRLAAQHDHSPLNIAPLRPEITSARRPRRTVQICGTSSASRSLHRKLAALGLWHDPALSSE